MKQIYRNQSMVWATSLALLLAVLLVACMPIQPLSEVNAQSATSNTEDVTAAVTALWDEYEASIEAADADRWGDLWVDDGVKYPPDGLPLEGKAAIVNNMREWLAVATANEVAITNHTVEVAGDFAFVRGLFRVDAQLKANGMPVVMDGKYMSILQRQADGRWKLYRDIFNANVPLAASGSDIAALSAELHQRFSDNDLEGAAALADENIKVVGYGLGLNLEGREQFLNFMKARKRAFPDITLEHTNVVVQGDQVVMEFVATGTHLGPLMTPNGEIAATGKPITLHVVEIHTWKDGKLVNLVQYQDPTSPLRQIGVMK